MPILSESNFDPIINDLEKLLADLASVRASAHMFNFSELEIEMARREGDVQDLLRDIKRLKET